jgi:hypothetical protein
MELINHKNAETYAITQRTSTRQQQGRPSTLMNSDFLNLALYDDFIVQNILSSLLLLCYNLMIMNKS